MKKTLDRVAKVFALLNEDQAARLEQGALLDDEDLAALAIKTEEPSETIHQDLSNFLHWLKRSPELQSGQSEGAS